MNIQFIYNNLFTGFNALPTSIDYHTSNYLIDWLPSDITYWRGTTSDETMEFDLTNRNVKDLNIVVEGSNWTGGVVFHAYYAGAWHLMSTTNVSYGNFIIYTITSDMTTALIKINPSTNSVNILVEAGQIILADPYENTDNPDMPFLTKNKQNQSISYRSTKNHLIRHAQGLYYTYELKFSWVSETHKDILEDVYTELNEHPILMNMGDIDTQYKFVGLDTGATDIAIERLVSNYYNLILNLEDVI